MRGIFVLLATSLLCSSALAADMALVKNAKMKTVDAGMEISVSVTAPRHRSCYDLDILVRLGREELEAGKTILDDLVAGRDARRSLQWTLLSLQGDSPERNLYVHITEQSPIAAGKSILLLERKDRIFIRFRLPNALVAGQKTTVKFTLPFADQESSRPLKPTAMVIGYWMNEISTRDFVTLPAKGVVGLTVLMRSAGLEGFEDRKARRKKAIRARPDFAAKLAAFVATAIKEANESNVPTLGVAAAVWLLPGLSGSEFIKMAVGTMASPNRSSWAVRFKSELAGAEKDDYLLWIVARQGIEPREGNADVLTRLLAMAAHYLESSDIPMLMDALAELEKAPGGQATVRSFAVEAGAALLEGITSRPQAEVEKLIHRLGDWRAFNAASELFEEQVLTALVQRVGRPTMAKALLGMTQEIMPVEVLQFMGHESELSRNLAYKTVSEGGLPALVAVREELIRRGFPPEQDVDAKAFKKNPELLKQLSGRLQGILLVRFADIFVELADRLHVLEGDCLMHLEQARREIHPQLLLPEPLWSQCRAMRAVILLGKGKLERAEKLIDAAMKASGDDRRVKGRYRLVRMARGRTLFEEGKLVAALAVIDEIDPHHKTQMILGLLGDIRAAQGKIALEAGHTNEARKLFIQARRLDPSQPSAREMLKDPTSGMRHLIIAAFIILMVIGVGAFLLNWLNRHQSVRDFCLLSEEEPLKLSGPGGRTFFVAGHAMLVRRRLTHWMIPWAELREVFKVPGDDNSSGGLLLWRRSGDAYFVSEDTCDDFGALIEDVEKFAAEAEVPFTAAHSDEQSEAAANFLIVRRLNVTDSRRILIQRIGFVLGTAATLSLCVCDLASGMSGLFLYAVAAGIGLGFTLVVMAISNALLPLTRA